MNCNFDRTYTVRLKGKVNTQTAEKFSEETLKSGFDRFPQELTKFLLDELSDNFDNFTVEVKKNMKAKIISFDEVLESIKIGNIKNIYIIDILSKFVQKVSDVEVESLVQDREDSIFIQAELVGE